MVAGCYRNIPLDLSIHLKDRRYDMKKIQKTVPMLFLGLLLGSKPILAQDPGNGQQDVVHKLQTRMDELRTQMAEIQSELDALHGPKPAEAIKGAQLTSTPTSTTTQNGSIQSTLPLQTLALQALQLPPEQQRESIGRETSAYQTFSDDPEAAARLYNAPLEPTYPGFFLLPGTQTLLRINGSLKTDFMYDPRPAGVPDAFIPSSIPIPSESSPSNFNASIRESRISADFRIPVNNWGIARMFVQFDFFGSNGATTPRLRHAYAQIHNFLVGQTFTNFMDPDAWPDSLDFQGPNPGLSVRVPQARYTFALGHKGASGSFSVEMPDSDINFQVDGAPAVPVTPAPDGAMRIRYEGERGHVQLASVLRELSVQLPNGGIQESALGWGFSASGALRTFGRDNIVFQVAYGHGISRYVGDTGGLGLDAAPRTETNLSLRALPLFGPYISYQHYWTRNLRSTATFGFVQLQNTDFQPSTTYHKSTYSSANIIWNVVGSLDVGAEFLYGWVEEKSGATASAPRFQITGRYTFVKLHPEE
jgi:DcaP outer membrane protein